MLAYEKIRSTLMYVATIAFASLTIIPFAGAAEAIPGHVAEFFNSQMPTKVSEFEKEARNTDSLRLMDEDPTPRIGEAQMTYIIDANDSGKLTIQPSGDWSAVVYHADKPTGIAIANRRQDGQLEAGWTDNANLAQYLDSASENGDLIEVPWAHAYFLRRGTMLTALNDSAKEYTSEPIEQQTLINTLQPEFDSNRASNEKKLADGEIPVSGSGRSDASTTDTTFPWRIVVPTACGVMAVLAMAVVLIRRRRS